MSYSSRPFSLHFDVIYPGDPARIPTTAEASVASLVAVLCGDTAPTALRWREPKATDAPPRGEASRQNCPDTFIHLINGATAIGKAMELISLPAPGLLDIRAARHRLDTARHCIAQADEAIAQEIRRRLD